MYMNIIVSALESGLNLQVEVLRASVGANILVVQMSAPTSQYAVPHVCTAKQLAN